MKFRTDFVTNSSSYSSAEIKIDNPILLEIIKKYKTQGAFEGSSCLEESFAVNEMEKKDDLLMLYDPYIEEEDRERELGECEDREIALYLYEEGLEAFFGPESVEEIIGCILKLIEQVGGARLKNPGAYRAFKKEILARSKEINENYENVLWNTGWEGDGDAAPDEDEQTVWEFIYRK